jgi:platelet-activating factor acetylhydrolase isoform II
VLLQKNVLYAQAAFLCALFYFPLYAQQAATEHALPPLTGPYAVGRTTLHVVDASRSDEAGSRADKKREFMVVVWYPATAAHVPPAAWLPRDWAAFEADGLLGLQLRRSADPAARNPQAVFASVVTHAGEGAQIADHPKIFPVLVFSPGNLMYPNEYASLLEDLASHGYVIFGHVPTGYVPAVSFPSGNITRRYSRPDFSLWTGDIQYLLGQLALWNTDPKSIFSGRLDLNHVGVFGHSGGANAAIQIAHADQRVKACLAIDPGLLSAEDAGATPTLLFVAENRELFERLPDAAAIIEERKGFLRRAQAGFQVTLLEADHNSFTDMAVIVPFARPGNGNAFINTTRAVVRDFFDDFLLAKHSQLIRTGSAKYPLAKVEAGH